MTTATKEIKARNNVSRISSFFVSDMPICPASRDHEAIGEKHESRLYRVFHCTNLRKTGKCNVCIEKGGQPCTTPAPNAIRYFFDCALALAPVSPQSLKGRERPVQEVDAVYQRLGLLEMDCIRQAPWMETADGLKLPAEAVWQIDNPHSRRTITIV